MKISPELRELMNVIVPSILPYDENLTSISLSDSISILPENDEIIKVLKKLNTPDSWDKIAMKVFVNNLLRKQMNANITNNSELTDTNTNS